jgi:sterol desaturase/sphingolipid hydroxylase (fatty acid hydroxylase superfamily)
MRDLLQKYFKIHTGHTRMAKLYFRANHPIVPTLLFGGMAAGYLFLVQAYHPFAMTGLLGTMALGLFLWTFVEYSLHRFFFHYTPKKEPWRTIFSSLHLEHHRNTQDPGLILAPPTAAIIYSVLIFTTLFLLTWHWTLSLLMLAGINVGYIGYEWVHYGVHQFNWNRGLLGYYKRYHFHHHFQQPTEGFGVTSPFWDHIFQTTRQS